MIPFLDLKAQYASIKAEVDAAIHGVLDSCGYVLGPEVAEFEKEFAAYCGVQDGIGVNSGTSALHLALLAADVGPGDEVITTPFTFVATVAAIEYAGAKPVFVDIDPETFNIDPAKIEAAVTPKTRAIVPVHLHGLMAEMDPIMEIAKRHNLIVLEDACQAHGAEYHDRRAGSIGDLGAFSFYPGKNLGAYGEGGMVVTSNPELAKKIRMLRDWGAEKKYHHVLKGFNNRLEGIQGAVLRVKLRYLDQWTEGRRRAAAHYDKLLADSGVPTPSPASYQRHVYHVYAIRTNDREGWQQALNANGIQSGIHYPFPVHLLAAYEDLGYEKGDFPHAERAAEEVLSLPMFPELTRAQCETVASAVRELAGGRIAAAS
ncbi:MAG TPA: DegT/DnrJ/EryC1/StrS family aminotransferase [Gammaproteobacteria bacterium]|nr:DegT/DnrJ/EryC1/StrS family aminotransferase [Gammaproteobacteria bacterium]